MKSIIHSTKSDNKSFLPHLLFLELSTSCIFRHRPTAAFVVLFCCILFCVYVWLKRAFCVTRLTWHWTPDLLTPGGPEAHRAAQSSRQPHSRWVWTGCCCQCMSTLEIHSLESIFTWWRAVIWSNDGRKRGGEATTEIAKIIKSSTKHLLYTYRSGFLLKLSCFKSRAVSCRLFPGTECVSLLSSCVAAAPVKQLSTHVGLFCPTVAAPNSVPQPVCVS